MAQRRDPRVDPRVGDIVHDGNVTREVLAVEDFLAGEKHVTIVVTKVIAQNGERVWASTQHDWLSWARYTRIQRYAEEVV